MNANHSKVAALAAMFFPVVARAETANGEGSSTLAALFWTLLPLVFLALIFFWLVRRLQSPANPRIKKFDEHMERQRLHMDRVEQSLERIIKELEKKG